MTPKYLIVVDYSPGEAHHGRLAYGWKIIPHKGGQQPPDGKHPGRVPRVLSYAGSGAG